MPEAGIKTAGLSEICLQTIEAKSIFIKSMFLMRHISGPCSRNITVECHPTALAFRIGTSLWHDTIMLNSIIYNDTSNSILKQQ